MDQAVRARYDAVRKLRGKPFAAACYAPFVSLLFDPRGFVRSCCQDWTHDLGNVTRQRLRDIWDGERFAQLRRSMMAYELPSGCATCQWHIERGDPKGAYAKVFDGVRVRSAEPRWPEAMEFMLSNACNLECVQCVGELSSSIRKHREKLPPLPHDVYGDQFIEDLRPFLHHLDHATFMGGEPFLGRENFRIWDTMIEENTRFLCIVSTNGTIRNERVDRILDELPCLLVVSLDGTTRQTVESIRQNARFDEVMKNVRHYHARARRAGTLGAVAQRALGGMGRRRPRDLVMDAARGVVTNLSRRSLFGISFCLMPQNHRELGDFLLLAEELECEAIVNTVYHPQRFSMSALSAQQIADILKGWEGQDAQIRAGLRRHLPIWEEETARLRAQLDRPGDAPRDVYLASLGTRVEIRPSVPPSSTDTHAAREALLAWSGAAHVDEVTLDGDDIVANASPQFAGLEVEHIRGSSLTEVLLRLRERYGNEVEVHDAPHPLGMQRTMTFTNLGGETTTIRWLATGAAGAGDRTTKLIAATRPGVRQTA